MLANPELRRNVWLSFSTQRIILMPAIISLIAWISHLSGGSAERAKLSLILAYFFIFIWGVRFASEAVLDEVNLNTWDLQRQTALSPWSMAWGKLLGSTLYAWYGAIISLIFYVTSVSAPSSYDLGREIIIIICGGIFAQAIALLTSLQGLSQNRREYVHKTFKYFLLGCLVGFVATSITAGEKDYILNWFNFKMAASNFAFVSLILFTTWALIGLYQAFNAELQYQSLPIAWIGFTLFTMLYFAGLASNHVNLQQFANLAPNPGELNVVDDVQVLLYKAPYYVAFFIAQLLTYLALFSEPLTTVRYKKISLRLQDKSALEALRQIPIWLPSFILMLGAGILALWQLNTLSLKITDTFSPTVLLITSILFTVRDILIVHYFNFSTTVQRVFGASVIYLIILYILIPSVLIGLHLEHLNVIFLPSWGQNTLLAFGAIMAQIGIIGYLCMRGYRKSA